MQRIYLNPAAVSHPEMKKFVDGLQVENDNLILALHAVENHFGYIPREVAAFLAERFRIPMARIYEVITFYHYFRTKPPGRHLITVCNGTTCWLFQSEKLLQMAHEFKTNLPEEKQREVSIEEVRCIGCCALAPLAHIDGQLHPYLNAEIFQQELEKVISCEDKA
ncbi:MAG: NAD(P)H-dependent oxidoreductase subunit E [Leptospiraceae bacterium]|nr:NAD(P)H-dependent oxidoreductase subunit E [Leptospiraceae bacterium]